MHHKCCMTTRWYSSNQNAFSIVPCTMFRQSCGHGVQERQVECIHEVTRGALNTLVVDDSNCPQPPPSAARHCNSFDCPVSWEAGPWSRVRTNYSFNPFLLYLFSFDHLRKITVLSLVNELLLIQIRCIL